MCGRAQESCDFDLLPDNLILDIFKYLEVHDLIRIQRVCKRWRRLSHDFYLWTNIRISPPQKIEKRDLMKLVNHYFNKKTKSVHINGGAGRRRDMNKTISVSNAILRKVAERCPNLKEFKLGQDNLKEIELSLLPEFIEKFHFVNCDMPIRCFVGCHNRFTMLTSLELRRCPDFTENQMAMFGRLENLERLECYGCYRMTRSVIDTVASQCPKLRILTLVDMPSMGDESCTDMVTKLSRIESLKIGEWAKLTTDGVTILQEGLSHLKFLSVNGKHIIRSPSFDT